MTNRILRSTALDVDLGALLIRLLLGGLMVYHGWQKINMYDSIVPRFKDYIGIGSTLSLNLVIFAEFFCGILLILGLFTRLAVLPILFAMGVVVFIAHAPDPFMKKELPLVFLFLSVAVFVMGSGRYSLDRVIFK